MTWGLVTKQNNGAAAPPMMQPFREGVCVFLFGVCGPLVNDHHISIQNMIVSIRSALLGIQERQEKHLEHVGLQSEAEE